MSIKTNIRVSTMMHLYLLYLLVFPSPRLSSPSPNYRKDGDVVDGNDDAADDSEEERRGFDSLMANYELVRK